MKHNFKAEDWVKCISSCGSSKLYIPVGKVLQIRSLSGSTGLNFEENGNGSIGSPVEYFVLATIEEIPEEFRPKSLNLIESLIL